MAKRIALLRGINVGGIRIKMTDLAAAFRDLGLDDVSTILASGNVVFSKGGRLPALKKRIEQALSERFGYEAWVILLEASALARIVNDYPFDQDAKDKQPYVLFASDVASADALGKLAGDLNASDERIEPRERVIYHEVTRGRSTDTVFAKEIARARYKATTTTRNMRTLRKVLARATE